ncbi:hypothetical protein [Gordonia tangerina]|uniref:Uncharacterized protein n=1 Tax=Gordonia tangerina TaxID=2911060 RepID=A0ABS9DT45_9ACTN|nr:hypothetical protein [Gordonia tangerina]MCF3941116.1 hypothetical protein [Gordonia tangerina]
MVSGQGRDFEAYPDVGPDLGMPSVEWAQSPGVAHEDKYLEPFLRRSVPEFAGVVEEVRYLWSPTWPTGHVDQVTADSANPALGSLYAVGKLISVAVE